MSNLNPLRKKVAQPRYEMVSLWEVVRRYRSARWDVPNFQRRINAWQKQKKSLWIESLANHIEPPLGFLTYRVVGEVEPGFSREYLLDGLQRISTTVEALDHPKTYDIDRDEFEEIIRDIMTPVHLYEFDSHVEAFYLFQTVNMGTALTPADYYKGIITASQAGGEVYAQIPQMVNTIERHLVSKQVKPESKQASKYLRGSLALFYQYVSGTTTQKLWRYATGEVDLNSAIQVESLLAEYLKNTSEADVRSDMLKFGRYLDALSAEIESAIHTYYGAAGRRLSQTGVRSLYHLGIYRKNANIPIERYKEFLLAYCKMEDFSVAGVVRVMDENGEQVYANTISMQDLNKLIRIAGRVGIDFRPVKREKKIKVGPGYHVSHDKPVSLFGDGDDNGVFAEPGLTNMARGAKPVSEHE